MVVFLEMVHVTYHRGDVEQEVVDGHPGLGHGVLMETLSMV